MISRRSLLYTGAFLMTPALTLSSRTPVQAAERVQRLVTPKGIEVWLARQTSLPVIALDWAMRGGSTQDSEGRDGLANMTASLLDEGAGDIDSETFLHRLDDNAIKISFSAGRDNFGGSLKTLSPNKDEAFNLLRLALTAPRFDQGPTERVRQQILSGLRRSSTNPSSIASDVWWETAFKGHPYARRNSGTTESVTAITRDDLVGFTRKVLALEHLHVAVVGDITPEETVALIDKTFGDLPAKASLSPVPERVMSGEGERKVISLDVPQTVISFGRPSIKRLDEDYIPASIVNHILGGGSFTSRLYTEVREKRGLAYGVSSNLYPLDSSGLFMGSTSTRNDKAAESVTIIEDELRRMASDGPTEAELAEAKRYLVGSWALRFETSSAIAGNLLRLQIDGLSPDYLDKRNGLFEAVTLEDSRRAARRALGTGKLLVVAVGRPEGL
jgi:zinc protease